MKSLILAAIAIAFAHVAYASPATPRATITITPDNVDLTSAGSLKFPINWERLSITEGADQSFQVKLWFDGDGRAIQCTPVDQNTVIEEALCSQAATRAHFEFYPGFSLPFRRGFIIMRLFTETNRIYKLDVSIPVAFVPRGAGVPVLVVLPPPSGGTGDWRCSAGGGSFPDRARGELSVADKNSICTSFLQQQAAGTQPCVPIHGSTPAPTAFECRVAGQKGTFTSAFHPHADEVPGYSHAVILYPANDTPAERQLNQDDGHLRADFTSSDYPPLSLRWSLTGRVGVLLGITEYGEVATCRPLTSSGAAALDNATCALYVRRTKFQFDRGVSTYNRLRYTTSSITWTNR